MFPTGRKGIIRYLSTIPGPTETDPTASYVPPNKIEGIHCSIPLKNSVLPSEVLLWDLSTTTEIERWNDLWEEEPFPESIIQASLWEIFTCISQDKQRALRTEFFASAPAKIRCLVKRPLLLWHSIYCKQPSSCHLTSSAEPTYLWWMLLDMTQQTKHLIPAILTAGDAPWWNASGMWCRHPQKPTDCSALLTAQVGNKDWGLSLPDLPHAPECLEVLCCIAHVHPLASHFLPRDALSVPPGLQPAVSAGCGWIWKGVCKALCFISVYFLNSTKQN